MKIEQITDKNRLFSFFKSNYCLYSYHIGDLDDFFFNDCTFLALIDEPSSNIQEVCLIFQGLGTPTVLAFGLTENFGLFLQEILDKLPDKFYCHYLPEHENLFLNLYTIKELGLHQKMVLKDFKKIKNPNTHVINNLNKTHLLQLESLYKEAYPDTYFNAKMLETGYYYGIEGENKEILSVVGVHTYSKEYNMAVLGNITTHTKYRGKGYATILLQKLLTELNQSVSNLSLNVKKDNVHAIKLYRKLGFEYCLSYKEGFFEKI